MPTVKSRFVAYTDEEEDAARRLGSAVAFLWSSLPEVMCAAIIEQAAMIEPSSPAENAQRAAIKSFIAEKRAEGDA